MLHNRKKSGFTLVEIMIVVVIIGLLAAIAIPAFNKIRETSQNKAVMANLREVVSAAQQYMLDEGVASVGLADIVGPGLHLHGFAAVGDETYAFTVGTATTQVSTAINGRTVTYSF